MSDIQETHMASEQAALDMMQTYLEALNKRDQDALVATLHFPHYRLTDGKLKVWEGPDDYFADFKKRAGSEWHHTKWGELKVVQSSEDKVHLDVRVDRFREDDSPLISFRSLWVIAKLDGVWGAQLRSSFAPDARIIGGDT